MLEESRTIDRRKIRTRRQLKDALFSLILEKGYDAVKIEDITERADLGRTTFYLHYRDKDELLLESIDSIAKELISRMPSPEISPVDPDGGIFVQDAILITFQHAHENAQLYRVILRGEGAHQVSGRLHRIISEITGDLIKKRMEIGAIPLSPKVPVEVFSNYLAGSLLSLITWWLESGTPYPPEEMAAMFRILFFQGGRSALTIEEKSK